MNQPVPAGPPPAAIVPAKMLLGQDLSNGWKVVAARPLPPGGTGGHFSVGYIVEKATGERGFLKALDFVGPMQGQRDPARVLQWLTESFNFERDVLEHCKRMSRVVTAIEEGSIVIAGVPMGGTVQYLIFELADGDVRGQLDAATVFDFAWALRSLHQVATGLFQMHRGGVAHQDMKPSNVLVFEGGMSSKIGDLGRAASAAHAAPHDELVVAGDRSYAPPEALYKAVSEEWNVRRVGCDMYHLGSLAVFLFARTAMTPLLLSHLDPVFRPDKWGGSFADVLPHLRMAFDNAMIELEASLPKQLIPSVKTELMTVIRHLCEPDPALRGHPKARGDKLTRLALERFVAKLNVLATIVEAGLRR